MIGQSSTFNKQGYINWRCPDPSLPSFTGSGIAINGERLMGVIAQRRARGWTIVNDNGEALAITQGEAQELRHILANELDAKPYTTATPAKARFR